MPLLSHQSIKVLKIVFHALFMAILTFDLLGRALSTLPDDWLFFFTSGAIENFVCAVIAYVLYYAVLGSGLSLKKIIIVFAMICTLILLASLKSYRIHHAFTFVQAFEYLKSFLGQSLLYYLLVFSINRFELLGKHQQLEKELRQAREQLLRNQLHPHFLYNSFNSLYGLSLKNDPGTPNYILKLAAMMRYLTDETHLEKVPLRKELDFIEKYIAIEKIRFGDDARIQFQIEGLDEREKWIEPFLMITLVENAFKHGFYTNIKHAFVNIKVQIQDRELQFSIENSMVTRQHFQRDNRDGKGLETLKKRLTLLYPHSPGLMIKQNTNSYIANFKITLNEPV